MNWEEKTKWAWRATRVTTRKYPVQGSMKTMRGKLTGRTSTDYFHFDCPQCSPANPELDAELLGIRDDSSPEHLNARTIILGLSCRKCGLRDLVKIGVLEDREYQPRRVVVD